MTSGGTTFTLVTPYESVNVTMKLIGKFNVYNVLEQQQQDLFRV